MAHWIRLITLTEEGIKQLRTQQVGLMVHMQKVIEKHGGRLLTAFATLGNFDVLSLVECDNQEKMDAISEELDEQGFYTSETLPAIPLAEFLKAFQTSPNFGIFLESWLSSREATHRGGKKTSAAKRRAAPKASSEKGKRAQGINERKIRRTLTEAADDSFVVFGHVSPPVRGLLINLAIGDQGDKGGIGFRVTEADGDRLNLTDWDVGHSINVVLELSGEPEKISIEADVIRVDEVPEDGEYEIGVSYKPVPRAYHLRMEKFWDRIERG
jgi:uncharacterized protein with GYD domain